FNTPDRIAVDAAGNVYVVDYGNNRVEEFNSSGTYLSQFGSLGGGNGQLNGPIGVALDSSGKVYITDFNNNRVEVFAVALPADTEGVAYSQTITASGGSSPYTFTVVAGTLPNGLS